MILNKPTIPVVDDTSYNATSWNTNTDAPTKNAVRDKIETMDTAIGLNTAKTSNATHTGDVTGSVALTIADNAVTLAKMAGGTDGNLISYDTNGDPVAVATGTSGQVLTSNGA